MPEKIQAKGMRHIRNLKKIAKELHRDYGNDPGMFIDCIDAAMLEHRRKCLTFEKQKMKENTESGNPS